MSYLDIISLADAKNYLRVDDTLTEDDAQITRMISSALSYVEKFTNYILFARDKDYVIVNGIIRIYDYPINSVVSPTDDLTSEQKTLYTNYCYSGDETFTLNVGYENIEDIPTELIEVAYEIIDIYYYGKESGKTMADISPLNQEALNQYKRFIV